jgi:hypothetical protein
MPLSRGKTDVSPIEVKSGQIFAESKPRRLSQDENDFIENAHTLWRREGRANNAFARRVKVSQSDAALSFSAAANHAPSRTGGFK